MVSPLQTWQHSQPRYFWPVLGGLSVLTHVGLLGLSLPYVLELMQPNGDRGAAIATPIELVVVDSADDPITQISTAASEETASNLTEAAPEASSSGEQTAAESDSASAEPPDTERPPSEPVERPSPNRSDPEPIDTDDPGTSGSGGSVEPSDDQPSPDQTGSDQTPSEDQGEAAPEPDGEPSGPPAIPGDQSLESPDQSAGTESEQAAALSIVSHRQVPEQLQRDITDTPPVPLYGAAPTAVTLRPSESQCQRIAFPQPQATYRVAIRPDGTMARATPWTEGESRDLSDSEKAIACLLESAGFAFEPARIEGEPVLNDNLLLTVEVTESR